MQNPFLFLPALTGAILLSACQSGSIGNPFGSSQPPAAVQSAESTLNGTWLPTDAAARGVYEAEFRNGVFVSRSPSTNKPLARGSYRVVTDTQIDLQFVGAATNTSVEAKCTRQSPDTMYCVPSVGSPFNLRRT